MSENIREVYRAHLDAGFRYTYFLLAAVGAAIGFAITQTRDATLDYPHIVLGFAIFCWSASFFCGCRYIAFLRTRLFANFNLLVVESGRDPEIGSEDALIAAASAGIRDALRENETSEQRYGRWQFRLLIAGAVSYIVWHGLEMYLRAICVSA